MHQCNAFCTGSFVNLVKESNLLLKTVYDSQG